MLQDERNAALYANSFRRLQVLKDEQLADVKAAAKSGDEARVAAFLREVRAILEADHQAWRLARPPADPTVGPAQRI